MVSLFVGAPICTTRWFASRTCSRYVGNCKQRKCGCWYVHAGDAQLQCVLAASTRWVDVQKDVSELGPRKAMDALAKSVKTEAEICEWLQGARLAAIVGSCPRSLKSAKSGMRAWYWFYRVFLRRKGNAFPPMIDDLLAWSCVFRHPGTFSNYLGYVKLGCELVGVSTGVFKHASLSRARMAVTKKQAFVPRKAKFINLGMVTCIINEAVDTVGKTFAMLCLATYAFLLRLPSEALPIVVHKRTQAEHSKQPLLVVDGQRMRLELPRRKNRLRPTTLVRMCWCHQCKVTCPVHVLGVYLATLPAGSCPFSGYKSGSALVTLRAALNALGVAEASAYRTHDLRRGHAEDMRKAGKSLREILEAGDWRSAAFLDYLDRVQLEADVVADAHLADMSDDEP